MRKRSLPQSIKLTLLSAFVTACASCAPHHAATALTASSPAPRSETPGHTLVMEATGCWMGGLWSDALGETGERRELGIADRCRRSLHDAGALPDLYAPYREVEPAVVDVLARRILYVTEKSPTEAPRAGELEVFLRLVADVARETIHARRAADRVKDDATSAPAGDYARDKSAAAGDLDSHTALDAIFQKADGPYGAEIRTIALLSAIDRMEIARGLPKHLKIYALEGAHRDMFGVPPPVIADDAAKPIKTGTWLAYLTNVASAAGHPLPDSVTDPTSRERLAWSGVLAGCADRLRAASEPLAAGSELGTVARATATRLEAFYGSEHDQVLGR